MIPEYYGRLACLCFAAFFIVHTAVGAGVLVLAPSALRRAAGMTSRSAERLLLWLRLIPCVVGACAVAGLCIPSYLWLEPRGEAEPLGMSCAAVAGLGIACWAISALRTITALAHTRAFARSCQDAGMRMSLPGFAAPVLVVETPKPVLALAGIRRPQIILSRGIFEALEQEELGAALRHEEAHRNSRDNWKRLVMRLVPEILPFARCFAALERDWAKFSEWAADDAASAGDSQSALSLASALVQVAQLGQARQPELAASFTACGSGLEARVERLLHVDARHPIARRNASAVRQCAVLLAGATAAAMVLLPGALACVHGLLERLIR